MSSPHTPPVQDRLADLEKEMEHEKVELTPEIKTFIERHLEVIENKLRAGEPVLKTDLQFIDEVRRWVELEKIKKELEVQYPKRVETLEYFEFFEKGSRSIQAIDGQKYPMPTWNEIQEAITPEHLQKIKEHIPNPHLLVVPIGMPLEKIAQKVGAKNGKLPKQNSVYTGNWDIKADLLPGPRVTKKDPTPEELRYFGEDYTPKSGMSKSEFLEKKGEMNRFPGWQVLVVSGDKKVDPDTLNRTANDLKADFKHRGLMGLTPEEWLLWHGDNVREGTPADVWQEKSWTWNTATYLTKTKSVPGSRWDTDYVWAYLGSDDPVLQIEALGARPAVRIF